MHQRQPPCPGRAAPSALEGVRAAEVARGRQRWRDDNGCDDGDTRREGPIKSLVGGGGRLRRQRADLRWACAARRTALRSRRRATAAWRSPPPDAQRPDCRRARPRSRPRSPPRLTPRAPRRALPRPRVSATRDAPRGAHAPHAGRSHSEAGPDSPRASLPVSAASPGSVAPPGSRTPGSACRPSSSTPSLHAHPRARLRAGRPPPRARRRLAPPPRRGCEAPGAAPTPRTETAVAQRLQRPRTARHPPPARPPPALARARRAARPRAGSAARCAARGGLEKCEGGGASPAHEAKPLTALAS